MHQMNKLTSVQFRLQPSLLRHPSLLDLLLYTVITVVNTPRHLKSKSRKNSADKNSYPMCACVLLNQKHTLNTPSPAQHRGRAPSLLEHVGERSATIQQLHKTGAVKAYQSHNLTSFIINSVIVFHQSHTDLHSDSLYFLFHRGLYE